MHYRLADCPVCTTRDFTAVLADEDIKAQVEDLWQFQLRRLARAVPLATLYDRTIFSQDAPIHIACCRNCGTVMRTLQEDAIVDLYSSERPPIRTFAQLFEQQLPFFRKRQQELVRLVGKRGSVLEVGSYVGAFLVAASEAGWRAEGIDVNPHAIAFARTHGCEVEQAELEDLPTTNRYDVVAFWNCFEQLPQPARSLRLAARLLAPGGMIVVRVPNGAFFTRALRVRPHQLRTALLAYNNLLGFPYRHAFTPSALEQLVRAAGLTMRRMRGDALAPNASPAAKLWARYEETWIKRAVRVLARGRGAPWLELYALRGSR